MATIPASDNEFPQLLLVEVAAPSTPASGLVVVYAKSDGLLYWKDDAGAERQVSVGDLAAHLADATDAHDASAISVADAGGNFTATDVEATLAELFAAIAGGGIPATTIDAKGDLLAGTANDTVDNLAVGTNGYVLRAASGQTTGLIWEPAVKYALLQDQKTQNTAGGGFTSGAWQTRTLNTEVSDVDGIVAISANQFTPAAGTYLFRARSPAYAVDNHRARLQNVTAVATVALGSTEFARSSAGAQHSSNSYVEGRFTANGTDAYEVQHRCATTKATDGFGTQSNIDVEVYASIELWKVL